MTTFPDTQMMEAQKWGAKLLPVHSSYALVLKFELEREVEVVSRPTFVLLFGCPKPPPKVGILSKIPD